MDTVTVRDLRNKGAEVLRRVTGGETLTVTRDGEPVATLGPRRRTPASAAQLVHRRRHLPRVDSAGLRDDLDTILDPSL